jgi:endonuclease/exonuclease/phosphatase family metal-dependent hydrolase
MEPPLKIASYNIHKGMSHFGRRVVVHDLRTRLAALAADIVFLQEVQGRHDFRGVQYPHWPEAPQHEFLAENFFHAYGMNAVYNHGHHGNAILCRYPIAHSENIDISAHPFESRGMLHSLIEIPGRRVPLHALCVHLALTEGSRRRQMRMIVDRIRRAIPQQAPLILAGDFNDWRGSAGGYLAHELGLTEAFEAVQGRIARSYPAAFPVATLDRIYTRGFAIESARVLSGASWRKLSDHAVLTATMRPR